jgi:hypothetical protein
MTTRMGKHTIACAIDMVLGLVQNQLKWLYAWAGLSKSAVVFAEFHAYDERLFGRLMRFFRDLPDIPTLLMSASVPTARRDALHSASHNADQRAVMGTLAAHCPSACGSPHSSHYRPLRGARRAK